MTPGAVKLRESLQLSWRVYLLTKSDCFEKFLVSFVPFCATFSARPE